MFRILGVKRLSRELLHSANTNAQPKYEPTGNVFKAPWHCAFRQLEDEKENASSTAKRNEQKPTKKLNKKVVRTRNAENIKTRNEKSQ